MNTVFCNPQATSLNRETGEYQFNIDVQIFDTDCFGVMWHGSYIKWLEMGRVNLLKAVGVELSKPNDPAGYIYPVVDQHLRFKARAAMQDVLTVYTRVEIQGFKLIFHQRLENAQTGVVTLEATTTCMVLDQDWKVQRRLPAFITDAITKALDSINA